MQSQTLSDRRVSDIRDELQDTYGVDPIPSDALVRLIQYEDGVLTVDGDPRYAHHDNTIIPLLSGLLRDNFTATITIDMGAVKPVSSGADIMAPGVTDADESVKPGRIVSVIDEDNEKPIAVVRATSDAASMVDAKEGVVAESLHYVGDDLWDEFIS